MKTLVAVAVVALALFAASTAQAGPPNYLCTRNNVGQVIAWADGHWYRCTVKWTGNYGQYPVYYWLDIGFPAKTEV